MLKVRFIGQGMWMEFREVKRSNGFWGASAAYRTSRRFPRQVGSYWPATDGSMPGCFAAALFSLAPRMSS